MLTTSAPASIPSNLVWSASVKTLESDAASTAVRISAFVWSAVAEASIPSNLVPSVATSRPSTVPPTLMFPAIVMFVSSIELTIAPAPITKSKVLSASSYVTAIPVSVLLVTIAPTVSAIVSESVMPAIVIASASNVPLMYASLNCRALAPKSISLSVTGTIAPSWIRTCSTAELLTSTKKPQRLLVLSTTSLFKKSWSPIVSILPPSPAPPSC